MDELIAADPNYTYAVDGTCKRYEAFMRTSSVAQVNKDVGMSIELQAALNAWANEGVDPSNGSCWWDGLDFKTRYAEHPKVKDGFRFSDPKHNIFSVPGKSVDVSVFWKLRDVKTGAELNSKLRGKYRCVWISTAAHGKTIFWIHDPEYLSTSGGKKYR